MPRRKKDQNTLVIGDWNANCDRCDFKFKASELKQEWQGLYTCPDCFETRQPLDFLRGVPDDPSVPWSRPETGFDQCGPSSVPNQAVPNCAIPNHSEGYQNPL